MGRWKFNLILDQVNIVINGETREGVSVSVLGARAMIN
jgi:hypothetical protein